MQKKKRYRPDKDGKDKSTFLKYRRRIIREAGGDGYLICGICGLPINLSLPYPNPWSLTIDHITPVIHGGATSESNLQPAHFKCNRRKGDSQGITLEDINKLREEQKGKPLSSTKQLIYIKSINPIGAPGSEVEEDKEKVYRGLPQSANWRTY